MQEIITLLKQPFLETIYMLSVSTLLTVLIGLPLGTILVITSKDHIMPIKSVNAVLSYIVNMTRSFPFIILMIVIFPLTKFLIGKRIGTTAAIVPLVFAAVPFFARLVETSLREIPWGVIEASLSMGATTMQTIVKVMIPEAMSSIVLAITTTVIGLIGYSAMAGSIGGGGLGDLAIMYGYQRYQTHIMISTVIVLILLVQFIQSTGNIIAKKLDKKAR